MSLAGGCPGGAGRRVEIGRGRELVEIIDEPRPAPRRRVGRIRHANGENVAIDYETLEALMRRATSRDDVEVRGDVAILRA